MADRNAVGATLVPFGIQASGMGQHQQNADNIPSRYRSMYVRRFGDAITRPNLPERHVPSEQQMLGRPGAPTPLLSLTSALGLA